MNYSINKNIKNHIVPFVELSKEQQEKYVQLVRIMDISIIYYDQANGFNPSETDFKEWLTGLPIDTRIRMEIIGFPWCKEIRSFKRYVLEKNDIGKDHWMKENLNKEEYRAYCSFMKQQKNVIKPLNGTHSFVLDL